MNPNQYQPKEMVDIVNKVLSLKGEIYVLKYELETRYCTHLHSDGSSTFYPKQTITFSNCMYCNKVQ